jgi:hypothetical protein
MKIVALWLCLTAVAAAFDRQETIEFAPGDFETFQRDDYVLVLGKDMNVTDEPGRPQLPAKPVSIALPGLGQVRKVSVHATGWRELQAGLVPFPAQPQVILSRSNLVDRLTPADPAVYCSACPWPSEPWCWTGSGRRDGRTLVDLVLYPLRYVGAEQRLEYCPEFSVEVEYEPLPAEPRLDQHEFEYVIVTSSAFDSIFARLAAWKTQKGVPAVVRHIDWVLASYPGRDSAERLRNYLKTLPDSGVRWVLLGGDVSVVPFRKAFAMISEAHYHSREDSLPCDLYFADLDGTWDRDGDNVFGEIADSINLYPDLCVGRAPVDTRTEAQGFVNKVLQYEWAAIPQRQSNALFFAMVLWSNPYTDGGRHKDKLEARSFPSGYTVNKLYERLGNLSRTAVMSALRSGQNFSNHDGHGWIDVMSCGNTSLGTRDGDTITNAYRGVLYSIGCWTTAFDFTSIGEAFVANPNGGTVATIGHSSYGWGSPGNPGFGYSDRYDDRFWYEVLNRNNTSAGAALAEAKTYFVPFSREANVYRWHQYETNLMGDPEMPIWTRVPESLIVSAPASIPVGPGQVLVTVTHSGAPVSNALVCLMKGSESYSNARTNAGGQAWLATNPQTTGDFTLTVTAGNYQPWTATIPVSSGAYVNFAGWEVNDSLGNNDQVPNPSEALLLPVTMHNAGDAASAPTLLILRTAETEVVLLDSTEDLAALAPGESVRLASAFRVNLLASVQDGQLLRFQLVETSGGRRLDPVLLVGRPALEIERYFWAQSPARPGQTKDLRITCENHGFGWGHSTKCRLNSLDTNITVLAPDSVLVGELGPKTLSVPVDSFRLSIASGCPGSCLAPVEFVLGCETYQFRDTLWLLIGEFGFYDDMETGETQWTHGGTGDRWHRSTYRRHSGNYSWYCGDEASHSYPDNMNSWLLTTPFMVAENCSLRFWRWFDVPNYGVDGIYVIVQQGASAETLDFIGTGGALRNQVDGIQSDWFGESYDLSWIPAGDTVQIRIGFRSDNDGDRGEGFYIDDFAVTGGSGAAVSVTVEPVPPQPRQLAVGPSPFRDHVKLSLSGARDQQVTAAAYDATGRTVRSVRLQPQNGRVSWTWDGTDDTGIRLPNGVYLLRFWSPTCRACTKVVLER